MNRCTLITSCAAAVTLTLAAGRASAQQGLTFDYDQNLGWEGGRSSAPFLYKDVGGSEDFTVEVTIAAQTSGQWSDAGIIVRAKQGTPPGTGADNGDENFTFFGSFRTAPAAPNTGTTLHKRIEAGAQIDDFNVPVTAAEEPLPIRLRLVKTGADYAGWVSPDNGTTWQLQSTATAAAGTGLADPGVAKEVGLNFSSFSDTLAGFARFENFSLALGSGPSFADDFATTFDYTEGAVQGIWTGSYNMANIAPSGRVVANPKQPTLVVNTVTGATWIRNTLDEPMNFDYYEISSAAGRLSTSNWNSLSDQNKDAGLPADFDDSGTVDAADLTILRNGFGVNANGDADSDGDTDGADLLIWQRQVGQSPGAGDSWDEAGGISSSLLAELFLGGSTTIPVGGTLSLGNAFTTGAAGDLVFKAGLVGEPELMDGVVEYVTTGPAAVVPEPAMLTLVGGTLFWLTYASRSKRANGRRA